MEWRAPKAAGVRPAALGDLLLPLATNYTEQSYRLPISSLQDNFIISQYRHGVKNRWMMHNKKRLPPMKMMQQHFHKWKTDRITHNAIFPIRLQAYRVNANG